MSKKLWGGRFAKGTDPLVEEFTKSIQYDKKLAKYDVLGSLVHIQVLKSAGLLSPKDFTTLNNGLKSILNNIQLGNPIVHNEEDIHTFIQNVLQKSVGPAALKLHTARSRNDQVVFSVKLYCKDMLAEAGVEIIKLEKAFLGLAAKYADVILPGFTHLQHAQPVYLKDYLGAYVEMLKRDNQRLQDIKETISLTMGSGALAGTPVPAAKYSVKIDIPELLEIGVEKISAPANSLDTVSDRDFVIEIISALAILGMHLSRLAEDLVLWASQEFDFVEIDDAFCTGSSLMPQKKNPDVLELVRGNCGRLYGNLVSVLAMMKGLPLAYNRDMQLDKEPLFDSFELVSIELKVLSGLVRTLSFNKAKIEEHLKDESLYATDLVYYLVGKGVAFKEAHTIVGNLVKYSLEHDILIKSLPEKTIRQFSEKLVKQQIVKLFDARVSVKGKRSIKRRN
jgi:argininosuccinate lyase